MNCKGCLTNLSIQEYRLNKCVILNNAPKRNCPCQKCLVKTSCSIQCDKFTDMFYIIFRLKPSYDYKRIQGEVQYHNMRERPWYMRLPYS